VARDVAEGRFSSEEALAIYGVVLRPDGSADETHSAEQRNRIRARRLAHADPPVRALDPGAVAAGDHETLPIHPGVVQRGAVAYAEQSGTPLAQAPDHWTDGCPVLVERRWAEGPPVVSRSYLDPGTGRALFVEVALDGAPRSFEISPTRWTTAGAAVALA
jgi:N-methylhydantoinase B